MRVLVAGDFAPRNRVAIQIEKGNYCCLDSVKELLSEVDYSVVNFESPIVSHDSLPINKTGPSLRCSIESMNCIAYTGFRCITLANNHFRDYGEVGVSDTIDACLDAGLDFVGGGRSLNEATRVLYKTINGKCLAIINACEYEWSIATPIRGGSNPLDIVDICRDIKEAKYKCDYLLLIIHGGVEWYNLPTPKMQKLYRFFVDQGADVIINHHQHCISGYEVYNERPIFYGLGNFCFDKGKMERSFWNDGVIVLLEFDSNIRFSVIPIIQCVEDATVALCSEDGSILDKIRELNAVINNPDLLESSFQKFIKEAGRSRLSVLQPWGGTVLERFYSHGLLPGLLTREWKKRALALFRCESHREILLEYLENKFK